MADGSIAFGAVAQRASDSNANYWSYIAEPDNGRIKAHLKTAFAERFLEKTQILGLQGDEPVLTILEQHADLCADLVQNLPVAAHSRLSEDHLMGAALFTTSDLSAYMSGDAVLQKKVLEAAVERTGKKIAATALESYAKKPASEFVTQFGVDQAMAGLTVGQLASFIEEQNAHLDALPQSRYFELVAA